jgi:hypothetical protein
MTFYGDTTVKVSICINLSLTVIMLVAGCSKSSSIHEISYAVETTTDGKNWSEGYVGNSSGKDQAELRSIYLKAIRSDAYTRCYLSSGISRARGYLALRKDPINRSSDKPEFDLSCEEIRAKKSEWEI